MFYCYLTNLLQLLDDIDLICIYRLRGRYNHRFVYTRWLNCKTPYCNTWYVYSFCARTWLVLKDVSQALREGCTASCSLLYERGFVPDWILAKTYWPILKLVVSYTLWLNKLTPYITLCNTSYKVILYIYFRYYINM